MTFQDDLAEDFNKIVDISNSLEIINVDNIVQANNVYMAAKNNEDIA